MARPSSQPHAVLCRDRLITSQNLEQHLATPRAILPTTFSDHKSYLLLLMHA
jgi:hypothetical protein